MGIIDESRVVVQPLHKDWYKGQVGAVDMLRLDLLHPVISGNKWFKLRLNMKRALEIGAKNVVTFGGGFSNHLAATAFAAKMFGLGSAGIVRGKYAALTPTLKTCAEQGMELIFVTQEDYKNKHEPEWAEQLVTHFDELFIIPEGGANEWGRTGAGLIGRFIDDSYTHIAVSVGTGTTLTGLRNKINPEQQLLGFAPMKQGTYLKDYISEHVDADKNDRWQLYDQWHFGGFGRWNDELISFMNDFYTMNSIGLDMVYTAKMMYGLRELLANKAFGKDDRILCIHTGGLQGNTSVQPMLQH